MNCDCSEVKRIRKDFRNGRGYHVYLQCQVCGGLGNPQKKQDGDESLPLYNPDIEKAFVDRLYQEWDFKRIKELEARQIVRSAEYKTWKKKYDSYLTSFEWQDLRERVLRRDKWICQVCLDRKATRVHHETYFFHNLHFVNCLWLFSVCEICHKELHEIYRANKINLKELPE